MHNRSSWVVFILAICALPLSIYAAPNPNDIWDAHSNETELSPQIPQIPGIPPIPWPPRQPNAQGGDIIAAPFKAVTTSLKDAYPIANWLDYYSNVMKPQVVNSLTLAPGYYRVTLKSFCLHAGAYAPTQGSGYLLSPLKGSQAGLISSILTKWETHPEVSQQDVQTLIWGIEAGVKYYQYPPGFQARVAPLLSPQDIASMEAVTMLGSLWKKLAGYVPREVLQIASYFELFRGMLMNPQMSYAQLEQYAVLTGIPPLGPGSKSYSEGQWAYARDGFYVREVGHNGYQQTTIEILRPIPYSIERDAQGRIARLRSGRSTMDVNYQAQPGYQSGASPAGQSWPVAGVRMSGPASPQVVSSPVSTPSSPSTASPMLNDWTTASQRITQYGNAIGRPINTQTPNAQDLIDLTTLLRSFSSLSPAQQASLGAANTSSANAAALNAWTYTACVQLGQCTPVTQSASSAATQPIHLNMTNLVESPANTSMQRIIGVTHDGNPPTSNAQLVVESLSVQVPIDLATVSLPAKITSAFTSGTIIQNPTTITFSNQDQDGAFPTAGINFRLNIKVMNRSGHNLAVPSLQLIQTNPALDASGQRPQWTATPLNISDSIPSGESTLTYFVQQTWYTFSQPNIFVQFLRQFAADRASDAVDLLNKLGAISSASAGAISGAISIAPGLINVLQTRFIWAVDYQLAFEDQTYSVSYSGLPCGLMDVLVMAPPQEIGAFSVFLPLKMGQVVAAPLPFLGDYLAKWRTQEVICQNSGQDSNACKIASAGVDDAWYYSTLTGANVSHEIADLDLAKIRTAPSVCQQATSQGMPSTQRQTQPQRQEYVQPTSKMNDQVLTSNINERLKEDSVLKSRDIHVSSQGGVVTLTGTVRTQLEKAAAERIARAEKGVQQVINQLAVSASPY
jgi:hypothetical protein